jgi:hypothetical protein
MGTISRRWNKGGAVKRLSNNGHLNAAFATLMLPTISSALAIDDVEFGQHGTG